MGGAEEQDAHAPAAATGDNLAAYALGALDPGDVAAVELALATDEAARRRLAAYRAVATALALSAPPVAAPAGVRARLLARLATGQCRAADDAGMKVRGAQGDGPEESR